MTTNDESTTIDKSLGTAKPKVNDSTGRSPHRQLLQSMLINLLNEIILFDQHQEVSFIF